MCESRYCPSLETKFSRFPGRTHHVWLEPEGLASHVLYPNGLSNSLEPEDQLRLLKTVPGVYCIPNLVMCWSFWQVDYQAVQRYCGQCMRDGPAVDSTLQQVTTSQA